MSKDKAKNENFEKAIENILVALWKFTLVWFEVFIAATKRISWKSPLFHYNAISYILLIYVVTAHYLHLKFLHWILPTVFDYGFVDLLLKIPRSVHFLAMFFGTLTLVSFLFGYRVIREKRKFQESLNLLSLGNSKMYPKVVKVITKDKFRKQLVVLSQGVGPERYKERINDLTAAFSQIVEDITFSKNHKSVLINLTSKTLPVKCHYDDVQDFASKPYHFGVGESLARIETCDISKLPHMLIAGTTGGGKSVFFKQTLLSILENSQNIQMYLLDLKGGVEMKDFTILPNVNMAKNETQAVSYLEQVEREMHRRFKYLEGKSYKEIISKRDKMDRILVGIDEASVLYSFSSKDERAKDLINRARVATDSIAKLGRAAGIHLILCTQKIVKEVIPTTIQDNVTGRMCFRVPSLQGSMTVLGNKMAMNLPDVKGRGIWAVGNDFTQVQAPYISDEDILEKLKDINEKWENNENKIFQKMFKIKEGEKLNQIVKE